MKRYWTEDELEFLRKNAKRHTQHWITQRIEHVSGNKRSIKSVQMQMWKLGINDQLPDGYVRPHWLRGNKQTGKLYSTVIRHAQQDGVLRRQRSTARECYLVPEKWLNHFLENRENGAYGYSADEIRTTWWDTAMVGRKLGKPHESLASELNKPRSWLGHAFNGAAPVRRWRDASRAGNKYWWHPDDVQRILPRWEVYKRTRPSDPRAHLLHNHKGSTINE
jgi:hypothetical protein